jgi:hypothetical protein
MAKVGDKRSNGGVSFTVVAVDSKAVYVKRSDESKKALSEREGAHAVSKAEFANWAKG